MSEKQTTTELEDNAQATDLEQQLEELTRQNQELSLQNQRALADYSNLKKRFDKERAELSKFAGEMALLQLLPAIDNLERAISYATDEDKKNNIVMGVVMTLQQLDDTLKTMGLVRYQVKPGDAFDPHQHEAIESVPGDKDKVVEVIEAGYLLHDKVVRPAKVKVGNGE